MDPYKAREREPEIGDPLRDRFKESFKKYKTCKDYEKFKSFTEIFEPERANEFIQSKACVQKPVHTCDSKSVGSPDGENGISKHGSCLTYFGLTDPSTWEVFEFSFPEGLMFIKNPFTPEGQRYWIARCLNDYPFEKEHITNIENLRRRKGEDVKYEEAQNNKDNFYKHLRWITFGYHHDWDTKIYSEDYKCEFPADLAELTKYLSLVLGYKDFSAEAAIVNYYHMDSTLSGHVDRSEKNQFAPLFSLSFGQTALFLIGGQTKDQTPLGMYLKSGDIAIMAGRSRLSYHAVPKILPAEETPWLLEQPSDSEPREVVNLSIGDSIHSAKKLKLSEDDQGCCVCQFSKSSNLRNSSATVTSVLSKWSTFCKDYIGKSRINLNIRQVLFPGQKSLLDDDR